MRARLRHYRLKISLLRFVATDNGLHAPPAFMTSAISRVEAYRATDTIDYRQQTACRYNIESSRWRELQAKGSAMHL